MEILFKDQFSLEQLPSLVDRIIAKNIVVPNRIVILGGELGAGKTTFTRVFFEKFGITNVTSPTYNLHNEFSIVWTDGQKIVLNHWDLYRCRELPEELLESVSTNCTYFTFIEWGDRFLSEFKSQDCILINIEVIDQNNRKIIISG